MDDKTTVPPYESNQNSIPQHAPMQHATSYGSAPGQPMVQHDIYQQPISPLQTGTTPNNYPNQPPGSPPPEINPYPPPQMSQQQHPQAMSSPPVQLEHPKGDYYGSQQQVPTQGSMPMQHVQSNMMPQMQQHPSQYHSAVPIHLLQRTAMAVDCPVCRNRAITRTELHTGNTTHAWALVICCVFALGCIPYLIDSLKDVEHKCGHCGVALATWHRSGHTEVHAPQ